MYSAASPPGESLQHSTQKVSKLKSSSSKSNRGQTEAETAECRVKAESI